MNLPPKRFQELSEAARSLSSNDTRTKLNNMRQIIHFFGKGYNCVAAERQVTKVDPRDNVSLRRFRNIMNVSYSSEDSKSDIISTILSDFENKDPLIKSIAVRQAGFFSTKETASTLIPIILKASQLDDSYIRKTAALSILRVYQNDPVLIPQYNLDLTLHSLLDDQNPNVLSNAISAISEINTLRSSPIIKISISSIEHMLSIIEDATEWAQIQIIDFITENMPPNPEAVNQLNIVNRLSAFLYYSNPGLTMSTVRCCLKMCIIKKNHEWTKEVLSQIMPPLVFLLDNCNEIQYIVLRSITVILQKYKSIFSDNVNFFFCKPDEPSYIRNEKLDIIWLLSSENNAQLILNEITKYSHDKDVKFARKSIQIIGKLAVMIEKVAENCVEAMISLIQTTEVYVVQECVIVSVNILRKYPFNKKFDNLISAICMNFNAAVDDHHRSKAAMAWILGEYAGMITNAAEHIEAVFLENFLQEPNDVQLTTLTAIVKYYLIYPEEGQEMLKKVLTLSTNSIDNPDLRDHAMIYISILTECGEDAVDIIMSKKNKKLIRNINKNKENSSSENIENSEDSDNSDESEKDQSEDEKDDFDNLNLTLDEMNVIDPSLADILLPLIGSLAVMYKQLPEAFTPNYKDQYSRYSKEEQAFSKSYPSSSASLVIPATPTKSLKGPSSPSKFGNASTSLVKTKNKFKHNQMQMNLNFNTSNVGHRHSSAKRPLNMPRDFGSWSEEERSIYDSSGSAIPSGVTYSHHRNKSVNYAHYIYNNEYNFNYNINDLSNFNYVNSSDASDAAVNRSFGQIQIPNQKRAPESLGKVLVPQPKRPINKNDQSDDEDDDDDEDDEDDDDEDDDESDDDNDDLFLKKNNSDLDDVFDNDRNNSDNSNK
ncbi:hypothetical protein M9Y10_002942 [Tritrichomonas musculus]|uniref:AP complex subunit beta n=1 Tax=Tritrichomonas musculus TaxID=1915356 RepID=A0ABR2LB82_9EUKA